MPERRRSSVVVICSHSMRDPLVSSLMLDYSLRLQAGRPGQEMLFFTEEPAPVQPDTLLQEKLAAARIHWIPLRYRIDGVQLLQKFRNLMIVLFHSTVFAFGRRCTLIGFLAQAGAFAGILRCLWFRHFVLLCFEPHSRYMLEQGIWTGNSVKYRSSQWMERMQVRMADVIIVPTRATLALVKEIGARGRIELQAITLSTAGNLRDDSLRAGFRSERAWDECEVLVYVGKFGGIYYSANDYLRFMSRLSHSDARYRFLIIASASDCRKLAELPGYDELASLVCLYGPVPPNELARLLSVADAGVIAIPPDPAQVFRTPVKTAHYWMAGLPIVVPQGVSDDHLIAQEEGVGVVVNDLPDIDPVAFRRDMDHLLAEGPEAMQERCMEAALKHRNTDQMIQILNSCLP